MQLLEKLKTELYGYEYNYKTERMAVLDSNRYQESYLNGTMMVSTSLHRMAEITSSGYSVFVETSEDVKDIIRAVYRMGNLMRASHGIPGDMQEDIKRVKLLVDNLMVRNSTETLQVQKEFTHEYVNLDKTSHAFNKTVDKFFTTNETVDESLVSGKPFVNQKVTSKQKYMERLKPDNLIKMKAYYEDNKTNLIGTEDKVSPLADMKPVEEIIMYTNPETKEIEDIDYEFLENRKYLLPYIPKVTLGKLVQQWEDKQHGYTCKSTEGIYKDNTICYYNNLIGIRVIDNTELIVEIVKHLGLTKEQIDELITTPEAHKRLENI